MPVELLNEEQWRVLRGGEDLPSHSFTYEGMTYYADLPDAPVKKVRRMSGGMNPISKTIKELHREIALVQDRIKKLSMIRDRTDADDLDALIEKWKAASQAIILELYAKIEHRPCSFWEDEHSEEHFQERGEDSEADLEKGGLGQFGRFLKQLGLDAECRGELDYDSEDDCFK